MNKFNKNMSLVGFTASGKTTLGRQLATSLKCSFIDIDQLIEQHHPTLSCREIFQTFGESYFRDLESRVITSLSTPLPAIIAIGGGSLLQPSNARALKAISLLIYLKTSEQILEERINSRPLRPAYLGNDHSEQGFTTFYHKRIHLYEQWADVTIEMDSLSPNEALQQLIEIGDHCGI